MKIGIIGCGNISATYVRNFTSQNWPQAELVACADLDLSRAEAYAAEHSQIKAMSVDELIASDEVELVLNLTIPKAHYPVALQCIRAGKHHYSEKPMALTGEEAREIIEEAAKHGVKVGCAPDTFLGAGVQTAIQAIKDGTIGTPISIMGHMFGRGHEYWHPAPAFYYQVGGGPLLDMGPYYLTAMVAMLGKVTNIQSVCKRTLETRTIHSEPQKGEKIEVEVDTHITALLEFESGVVGTLTTSFDAPSPGLPLIAVVGTEGTIWVPDPNGFGGEVKLIVDGDESILEPVSEQTGDQRGLGIVEMIDGILHDKPYQASGEMACHVLETMEKILEG